jgi:anti-sigma regulatory factor (Ser/Thr protein kinase)
MHSPSFGPDAAPSLSLRVANTVAALEGARAALDRFCKDRELPERTQFKLELVLEEMLMNRVLHAFAPGTLGHTDVTLRLEADRVVLGFEDDGVAFDPLQAAPPARPTTLQDTVDGGLGLVLTRKAARECRYEHTDGRNRFTVVLDR